MCCREGLPSIILSTDKLEALTKPIPRSSKSPGSQAGAVGHRKISVSRQPTRDFSTPSVGYPALICIWYDSKRMSMGFKCSSPRHFVIACRLLGLETVLLLLLLSLLATTTQGRERGSLAPRCLLPKRHPPQATPPQATPP